MREVAAGAEGAEWRKVLCGAVAGGLTDVSSFKRVTLETRQVPQGLLTQCVVRVH